MLINEIFNSPADWKKEEVDRNPRDPYSSEEITYGFMLNTETGETMPASGVSDFVKQTDEYQKLLKVAEKEFAKIDKTQPPKDWIEKQVERHKRTIDNMLAQTDPEMEMETGLSPEQRVIKTFGTTDPRQYVKDNFAVIWGAQTRKLKGKTELKLNQLERDIKKKLAKKYVHYEILIRAIDENSILFHIENPPWSAKPEHKLQNTFKFLPKDGLYEVHFTATNIDEKGEIDFKSVLTGTGHAVKVMATVKSAVFDALSKPKVKHLLLSARASEPSRVRLYNRMIGKAAKKRWEHKGIVYWLA